MTMVSTVRGLTAAALALASALSWSTAAPAQTWTMPEPTGPVTCLPEGKDLPLAKAGSLTMSINATLPPKQYIDKTGKIVGMHVDMGNEIARRLCLKPSTRTSSSRCRFPDCRTSAGT